MQAYLRDLSLIKKQQQTNNKTTTTTNKQTKNQPTKQTKNTDDNIIYSQFTLVEVLYGRKLLKDKLVQRWYNGTEVCLPHLMLC